MACAAKAAPVGRASMSISVVVMVAIFLISLLPFLGFCLTPRMVLLGSFASIDHLSPASTTASLPAPTVPPRLTADHAQSTHNVHTASFVWVPCGFGGRTADPEGNRRDRGASTEGLRQKAWTFTTGAG